MAGLDFSHYGGPSEEWLAIEKSLPSVNFDTSIDAKTLQSAVNTERENRAAAVMVELAAHVQTKDFSIPTRDGSSIEARTYRSKDRYSTEKLPVYVYFHGGGFIFGTLSSEGNSYVQQRISGLINSRPHLCPNGHQNWSHCPQCQLPSYPGAQIPFGLA